MRPPVLFIGHSFHDKTLSSDFFIRFLKTRYDVSVLSIDPTQPDIHLAVPSQDVLQRFRLVALWQLDFLAPLFYKSRLPLVIIPMYDGSGSLPDAHWYACGNSLFVNFSLTLHLKLKALGFRSIYIRYYPSSWITLSSSQEMQRCHATTYDSKRVFFWRRNPSQVSLETVSGLFPPGSIDHLHVHDAPDSAAYLSEQNEPTLGRYASTSITRWFKNKSDYHAALASCNIFMAPRLSEGIGLGFLEAMSFGHCVVAPDFPTHNEYILNWVTGVLYDPSRISPLHIDLDQLHKIGLQSQWAVRIGTRKFEERLAALYKILDDYTSSCASFVHRLIVPSGRFGEIFSRGHQSYIKYIRSVVLPEVDTPQLQDSSPPGNQSLGRSAFVDANAKFRRGDYLGALEIYDSLCTNAPQMMPYRQAVKLALLKICQNSTDLGSPSHKKIVSRAMALIELNDWSKDRVTKLKRMINAEPYPRSLS